MQCEPRPRLCFLTKGPSGYGFHLHGERNKGGQFIRIVEPGSSAELAGLRAGDRVVEVNGENVENETHQQVVQRIRAVEHRTRLLVIDRDADDYLHRHGLACTEDLAIEMGNLSPQTSLPSSPIPQGDIFSPPLSPIHVLARALTNSLKSSTRTDKCSPMSSPMTDTNTRLPSKTASSDADVPMATKELVSRLCHLVKGELGYGFNLYSDKTRQGQFVRSVDPGSPADQADLRPMDRLVEVNGVNIEALTHSEVVSYIQDGGNQTQLLVVDAETDKLFKKLGVTPTVGHTKEVYVDEPMTDSAPTTPIMEPFSMHPPIINFTQIASPIPSGSPKSQPYDSSASHSSQNSATQSEFSSSDMSIQIAEADEQHLSDPFIDIGLHLSPTAAEAKERVRSKLTRKRAPPMDWRQRQEMFSNL